MNNIIESANKVRNVLMQEPLVQSYLVLKKQIENDSTINKLLKENSNASKEELYKHPIYNNYLICKEEVFNLLEEISRFLSD